jgi:hypothetical protein
MRFTSLPLIVVALLAGLATGEESGLKGIVTDAQGKPLAGVKVFGSSTNCCPAKSDQAETNSAGEFHLDHPGGVIRLRKEGFAPQSFVVRPDAADAHIVLREADNNLTIPQCKKSRRGYTRVGFQHIGFDLPKHGVQVRGGKWDVDYVRYVIRLNEKASSLELWFGPYAISSQPDDKQFIDSLDFAQREATITGVGSAGMESSGHFANGNSWRRLVFMGAGGATYRDSPPQEAVVYDQIIESACFIPFDAASH